MRFARRSLCGAAIYSVRHRLLLALRGSLSRLMCEHVRRHRQLRTDVASRTAPLKCPLRSEAWEVNETAMRMRPNYAIALQS